MKVEISFLGKDSILYSKVVDLPEQVIGNIKHFIKEGNETIFYGISSSDVTGFLSEVMPKLTSKVFRTYLATNCLKESLKNYEVSPKTKEWEKVLTGKYAVLMVAELMNHRKTMAKNFAESLKKKEERLHKLLAQGKTEQADKLKAEIDFAAKAAGFNLNTSLRAYLDPRVFMKWCKQVNLDPNKIYSKTLMRKVEWSLQ